MDNSREKDVGMITSDNPKGLCPRTTLPLPLYDDCRNERGMFLFNDGTGLVYLIPL